MTATPPGAEAIAPESNPDAASTPPATEKRRKAPAPNSATHRHQLPAVLSIDEAAHYLRIDGRVLVTMARAKKIGSLKIGRTLTFPLAVLEEYVEKHTVKAEDNQWGLTDAAVKAVQDGRPARTKKKKK